MSTRIPFFISHNEQGLKLIDLPPDLLALLESPNPPNLEIKSSPPSTTSKDPSFAVLCSPTQTYLLRQQQTSNSLFVICPTKDGIHTITTCSTTLELILQPSSSVEAYLSKLLPSWPPSPTQTTHPKLSKTETYTSTPHSTTEIDDAFYNLSIFTDSKTGHCYIPTPSALLSTWSAIRETSLANHLPLYSADDDEIFAMLDMEDDCPRGLFDITMEQAQIPILWLSRLLLEVAGPAGLDREEFKSRVYGLLPEGEEGGLVQDAFYQLGSGAGSIFEAVADLSDPQRIVHKKYVVAREVESKDDGDDKKPKNKKKQTWHERFRKN